MILERRDPPGQANDAPGFLKQRLRDSLPDARTSSGHEGYLIDVPRHEVAVRWWSSAHFRSSVHLLGECAVARRRSSSLGMIIRLAISTAPEER